MEKEVGSKGDLCSERMGFLTPEVREYVANYGTLADAPGVPDHVRDLFATALEIEPRQHLLMQAAFQAGMDNAVSKTIKLPTEDLGGNYFDEHDRQMV